MERARYMRFHEGVMSPGRGANTIMKAFSKTKQVVPPDELMDAIEVYENWVRLRRFRRSGGKILRDATGEPLPEEVRVLPRERVADYEPEPPPEPEPEPTPEPEDVPEKGKKDPKR